MASAPRSADHLGPAAQDHWQTLLGYLDALHLPYQLDHRLVRGLDYYTRTVFEIFPGDAGSQSAICAGGRYDALIQQLGGRPTPSIGFAAGVERIILNLQKQGVAVPLPERGPAVVAYRGQKAKSAGVQLAAELRGQGISVVLAPDKSLKAQMRYASGMRASEVLILGEEELGKGVVTIRLYGYGRAARSTGG